MTDKLKEHVEWVNLQYDALKYTPGEFKLIVGKCKHALDLALKQNDEKDREIINIKKRFQIVIDKMLEAIGEKDKIIEWLNSLNFKVELDCAGMELEDQSKLIDKLKAENEILKSTIKKITTGVCSAHQIPDAECRICNPAIDLAAENERLKADINIIREALMTDEMIKEDSETFANNDYECTGFIKGAEYQRDSIQKIFDGMNYQEEFEKKKFKPSLGECLDCYKKRLGQCNAEPEKCYLNLLKYLTVNNPKEKEGKDE